MGSDSSPYTVEREWFELTYLGLEFIALKPQEFPMRSSSSRANCSLVQVLGPLRKEGVKYLQCDVLLVRKQDLALATVFAYVHGYLIPLSYVCIVMDSRVIRDIDNEKWNEKE